jgi:hypothetical protein
MAIRGRVREIAQRLRPQTTTDETVLPAEVLSVNGFKLPTLDTYRPEAIGDFLKNFSSLPSFAYGKASGPAAGVWYAVKYPKAMVGAVPIAIGLGRPGSIASRTIGRVGDILLKTIEPVRDIFGTEITRVTRDDFNSDAYCKVVAEGARDRVKQLAPPWPLDIVWDFVCGNLVYYAFYAGWYVSGWVLNVLWDSFVQVQIDRVRDSINGVVGDANAVINARLIRIQEAFNSVIGDANTKINGQIGAIQDAVNLRLNDLYSMWGLPTNMAPTPLHIRNATSTGFQFQSYGNTTAYWFAIGQ